MQEIYCLMVGGKTLTDRMRTMLFVGACVMYQKKQAQARLLMDDLVARIQTEFKTTGLGCIYGTLFEAEVDSVHGKTTIRYIVQKGDLEEKDLERVSWVEAPIITMISPPGFQHLQRN